MSMLSDTQAIILAAAAQRADGNLLPLPGSLRGGAATKVVSALLARGLAAEIVTDDTRAADPALNRLWRNLPQPDGRGVLLYITTAGTEAIGVEPKAVSNTAGEGANTAGEPGAGRPTGADTAPVEEAPKRRGQPRKAAPSGADVAAASKTRDGTKQAHLVAMLRRKEGATITEIVEALSWAPHTVRGAFAGALKKRLGLTVGSENVEGRGRVYRLC